MIASHRNVSRETFCDYTIELECLQATTKFLQTLVPWTSARIVLAYGLRPPHIRQKLAFVHVNLDTAENCCGFLYIYCYRLMHAVSDI